MTFERPTAFPRPRMAPITPGTSDENQPPPTLPGNTDLTSAPAIRPRMIQLTNHMVCSLAVCWPASRRGVPVEFIDGGVRGAGG